MWWTGGDIVYQEFTVKRITQLRMQKGVSARDMSLSLGQNSNYINHIENGQSLPSLQVLFWICEYFKITPKEFFDTDIAAPVKVQELINAVKDLNSDQLDNLIAIAKDLKR